jgi:DNA replication and repair protein RecF
VTTPVYVAQLSLHDFRSYEQIDLALEPGGNVFVGPNGQGKTNLVEAIDYLSTLGSHRVATDAPLVRSGADRAVIRADVRRDGRSALLEVEIVPGGSNRARVNKSPLPRARELIGLLRTVMFSPEDLALVKGDPSERRRFLDTLLVTRTPRLAGARADYDRVLRQRNSLLKTAGLAHRSGSGAGSLATLEVWDEHLAQAGADLLAGRLELVEALRPYVGSGYGKIAATNGTRVDVGLTYKASFDLPSGSPDREVLAAALLAAIAARRGDELERGISLVGPHRDDVVLSIGDLPARGYASHGESWSLALALRIAAYDLLRSDGDDPILILDDVFSELDKDRRDHLADLVGGAEQFLVTAPVPQDVPVVLEGVRYDVAEGAVLRLHTT